MRTCREPRPGRPRRTSSERVWAVTGRRAINDVERPATGRGQPRAWFLRVSTARYGDFTHRNPMWLVALEISPLPRVPTM